MHKSRYLLFAICGVFSISNAALADVRLPGFYGDHMVLQQQKPIRLRGWAEPGEKVKVSLASASVDVTTGRDGHWQAELPAMQAGKTPLRLTVKGNNTLTINDVLIGEVWLCSGQSNMEWSVRASANAKEEIAAADYPLIRHMKVGRKPNNVPQDDLKSEWQVCSPDSVPNFTACGYFMARTLFKKLDVPIGLVNSSWGGTRVEPWTPPVGFQKVPALADIHTSVLNKTPGTPEYKAGLKKHIAALSDWVEKANGMVDSTDLPSPSPSFPASLTPFRSHQDPTMLYNGMIHALVGFPIRGAIWYQGESNHNDGMMYFEKKKALINGWRELWQQGDFPFYYVQIAPFQYGNEDPTILARFWEAQAAVQELPKTGMVVINDIATLNNIHPPNKQDVGLRLANLALKNDYGMDVVAHSPELQKLSVENDALRLMFKNTGGGLKTRDGKTPSHFEIISRTSNGFQPATAEISGDGNSVILKAANVKAPTAFRFAWNKLAEPNLCGGTGLPVSAFRAGELPKFTDTLPLGTEYRLVYELDLSRLGKSIKYSVDNSSNVGSFNRIGYLVELSKSGSEDQAVFVSMDAFTQDVKKIGIPTVASKAAFQQPIKALDVFSNVQAIKGGRNIKSGNIEFWPNNYGPQNKAGVRGAAGNVYDFGDERSAPVDGYGCMQIHNFGARQTLFAINHWSAGARADIGIGNSPGESKDWTFQANAESYSSKRLRVYVK